MSRCMVVMSLLCVIAFGGAANASPCSDLKKQVGIAYEFPATPEGVEEAKNSDFINRCKEMTFAEWGDYPGLTEKGIKACKVRKPSRGVNDAGEKIIRLSCGAAFTMNVVLEAEAKISGVDIIDLSDF